MNNRILKKTIILAALFLFVFSVPANAANYKKAYRKIVKQIDPRGYDEYSLVFIDNNKIPELVCTRPGGGGITIYTYRGGKAKCLINNGSGFDQMWFGGIYWKYGFGAHGFEEYYYIPKKNKMYNRTYHAHGADGNSPHYVDTFFRIKKGRFVFEKSIKFDVTNAAADKLYQIRKNYKALSGNYSKKKILKKLK